MKYRAIAVALLLASLTIQADPYVVWNWVVPTQYENNNPIPSTDALTYTLYCNDQPEQAGPPYEVAIALDDPGAPPSVEDMAPVANGRVGTYHCAATARSTAYGTESVYSNEVNFTVTPDQLGFVPKAPTALFGVIEDQGVR